MPTEPAKNAVALLLELRTRIPGSVPSLTLNVEGQLVVGLCEHKPALQFQSYTLDGADLERAVSDVVEEIVKLRDAARRMGPAIAVTCP